MEQSGITRDEAINRLRLKCEEAGGVSAFAKEVGVSTGAVSQQLHGHKPIHGRVAARLGLKLKRETTIHYEEARHAGN